MGPTGSPETSVLNQPTPHNNPKDRRIHYMQRQHFSLRLILTAYIAAVLTFSVHKYEIIQSNLSSQQFGHVNFMCVQSAEQDLKVDKNDPCLQKCYFRDGVSKSEYKQ
jgi:hypothetical protein